MSTKSEKEDQLNIGEELFAEAAAALFEDTDRIARDISPEEAAEFEELRRSIIRLTHNEYTNSQDDTLSIAAEDEHDENYNKR